MTEIERLWGGAAGSTVRRKIDWWIIHDGEGREIPALLAGAPPQRPERVKVFLDHETPCGSVAAAEAQKALVNFAGKTGCRLYNGTGVSYQIMLDAHVEPGQLVVGCGTFGSLLGAAGAAYLRLPPEAMAASLLTGEVEGTVPETVAVEITGRAAPGSGKDLALRILHQAGGRLAGKAVEVTGSGIAGLPHTERLTLCQMLGASGAEILLLAEHSEAPRALSVDGAAGTPVLAGPNDPCALHPLEELAGMPVTAVFIGGCSSGRLEDLRRAAAIVRGKRVADGVRALVNPVTAEVFCQAADEGLLTDLMEAGFVVMNQGCGGCCAMAQGLVDSRDTVLSAGSRTCACCTAGEAATYLCSPATAAASALTGCVTAAD